MANIIRLECTGNTSVKVYFDNPLTTSTWATQNIAYKTQTAMNVNYTHTSTDGRLNLVFTRTAALDKFSMSSRYIMDVATNEYVKADLVATKNGANWDIVVDCTYEKKSTNVIKTARQVESINEATLDAREWRCDFDALIISTVNMFTNT